MQVPLYLITKNDGIPLPSSNFVLDIPEEKKGYFHTIEISLEANTPKCERIILGVSMCTDPWPLYKDLDELTDNIYEIGLLCRVIERTEADGFILLDILVESRIYLDSVNRGFDEDNKNLIMVDINYVPEEFENEEKEVVEQISRMVQMIVDNSQLFDTDMIERIKETAHLVARMDIIADNQLNEESDRLLYLQGLDNLDRFNFLSHRLAKHIDENPTLKKKRPKKRRRVFTDKKQLPSPPPLTLPERFKVTPIPQKDRAAVQREFDKLASCPKNSTEYTMLYDYLTWVLDVPWGKTAYTDFNLKDLPPRLNKSHHGLEDVKEHLLEHMTIEQIRGGSTGSILCFLGPPGTGKTTIAKEIAAASGRHLVRIALGGTGDEAEIRGHRRTYVASRPGRVVVGLKDAGAMDPLFLLDEVDKIPKFARGDPTSALLELLDPEQNDHFIDRYIEVPIDLSKAMFICTANYKDQIPEALADRMEFIQFREYSVEERKIILNNYLLPKAYKKYNLVDWPIEFAPEVLEEIAETEQVRKIEQKVQRLLRKAAAQIYVYEAKSVLINSDFVKNLNKAPAAKQRVGFS